MITVFRIDAPPTGIETGEDGAEVTPGQIEEEIRARQAFVDAVSPYLAALPDRPISHSGNVEKVELLGADVTTRLNRYLLLVTVDVGDPRIDFDSFVPVGTTVTPVIEGLRPVAQWPAAGRS
ncbi:hypothetical protein ACWC5I_45210 [Kitasatospora sp. NPDC001574]